MSVFGKDNYSITMFSGRLKWISSSQQSNTEKQIMYFHVSVLCAVFMSILKFCLCHIFGRFYTKINRIFVMRIIGKKVKKA